MPELAAAAARHMVIIEISLVTPGHIGLVNSAFFFTHIRQHFAIAPRACVDQELPVSQLFELLKFFLKLFPFFFP